MTSGDYYHHPRPEMAGYLPAEANGVLDIGCGTGRFAAGLKAARPLEAWGIEIDPEAARQAADHLDEVRVGDASDELAAVPDRHFDCIYLNDILEHLVEPDALLAAVAVKLAPGGRIVASLPNVRYFHHLWQLVVHGRWDYADEGILDRTHLRFFTRSSLLAMFDRCGYRVLRCDGIHRTGSLRWHLCNLLTLGRFAEMRYLQFAVVAVPAEHSIPQRT